MNVALIHSRVFLSAAISLFMNCWPLCGQCYTSGNALGERSKQILFCETQLCGILVCQLYNYMQLHSGKMFQRLIEVYNKLCCCCIYVTVNRAEERTNGTVISCSSSPIMSCSIVKCCKVQILVPIFNKGAACVALCPVDV